MSITINGTGTVAGILAGGLNDGIIQQADLGNGVSGTGPAFSAYQSVSQTIGTTETLMSLDSVEFDTALCFSTSTNRFTPNVAGYYYITGTVQVGGAQGTFYSVLYKNGVAQRFGTYVPVATGSCISSVSAIVFLNGLTDSVELRAAAGTAQPSSAGIGRVALGGCLVRAATVVPSSATAITTTNGPTFRANRQSNQAFSSNVSAKVQLNTEDWDTANCFDSTTNFRFQPNIAGYYQVNYATFLDMAAGVLQQNVAAIYKNGAAWGGSDLGAGSLSYQPTTPANASTSVGTDIVFLNGSTDYIELWARIVSGSAINLNRAFMSGALVRLA